MTHKDWSDQDTFFPTILEVGNGKETFATQLPFAIFQQTMTRLVVSSVFNVHPYMGKGSNLTNGLKPPTR